LHGFRRLPRGGGALPLNLSFVGERAREAVEALIATSPAGISRRDRDVAARRVVLCGIIMLVAEARGVEAPGSALRAFAELEGDERARIREILCRGSPDFTELAPEDIGIVYEHLLEGGARKGSGTFYTRSELTAPTVRRTLEPLVTVPGERAPRTPEAILALRVCDPAMGSGAFLLAALRYLAAALGESVRYHGRPNEIADGEATEARWKWLVASRCLYGVDLDPVAVELAKAVIALDVMDPALPSLCLDERLKCGDALVGGSFERACVRPVESFARIEEAFEAYCASFFPPEDEVRFLHWELAFGEIFSRAGSGFDAIVGNPPWETQKPSSREFFSEVDPLYHTYGKQRAVRRQRELFAEHPGLEAAWHAYHERYERRWSWAAHAFRYQGSADVNVYKLFLELGHRLLREGGRLGFVVPAGIYVDHGCRALRELFLDHCAWDWLFGFENRARVFDIDSRFKFCVVIVQKGGETREIRACFMRRDPRDWEQAERLALCIPRERIQAASPHSLAIVEVRSARELAIMERASRGGVPLVGGDPGGFDVRCARELHTTDDSGLFLHRTTLAQRGFRADRYGHQIRGKWRPSVGSSSIEREEGLVSSSDGAHVVALGDIEEVALPVYEGRMIGAFDFSEKGWVRGAGRAALWRDVPWGEKSIEPQFAIPLDVWRRSGKVYPFPKVAYMRISSATNERTAIASYLGAFPAVDSIYSLRPGSRAVEDCLALLGIVNSFVFDHLLRARLGGLNVSEFVMSEMIVPAREVARRQPGWPCFAAGLALPSEGFAREWEALARSFGLEARPWCRRFAITRAERLRLRVILDAVVAKLYGLGMDDLRSILRDCDLPSAALARPSSRLGLDPKGFWREGRREDPELRHSVLTLVAFDALERMGLDAFIAQNDGEGYLLPEALCLAEYGLGRDARAKSPQPVAARLGPRFLPWQLEEDPRASWEACRRHAETIERIRDAYA